MELEQQLRDTTQALCEAEKALQDAKKEYHENVRLCNNDIGRLEAKANEFKQDNEVLVRRLKDQSRELADNKEKLERVTVQSHEESAKASLAQKWIELVDFQKRLKTSWKKQSELEKEHNQKQSELEEEIRRKDEEMTTWAQDQAQLMRKESERVIENTKALKKEIANHEMTIDDQQTQIQHLQKVNKQLEHENGQFKAAQQQANDIVSGLNEEIEQLTQVNAQHEEHINTLIKDRSDMRERMEVEEQETRNDWLRLQEEARNYLNRAHEAEFRCITEGQRIIDLKRRNELYVDQLSVQEDELRNYALGAGAVILVIGIVLMLLYRKIIRNHRKKDVENRMIIEELRGPLDDRDRRMPSVVGRSSKVKWRSLRIETKSSGDARNQLVGDGCVQTKLTNPIGMAEDAMKLNANLAEQEQVAVENTSDEFDLEDQKHHKDAVVALLETI